MKPNQTKIKQPKRNETQRISASQRNATQRIESKRIETKRNMHLHKLNWPLTITRPANWMSRLSTAPGFLRVLNFNLFYPTLSFLLRSLALFQFLC